MRQTLLAEARLGAAAHCRRWVMSRTAAVDGMKLHEKRLRRTSALMPDLRKNSYLCRTPNQYPDSPGACS
jgi:hypothetical protein